LLARIPATALHIHQCLSSALLLLQVIYLGLVSFLDIRGGELLPPPPEAFENL
jgi:hypothetical protein